MKTKLHSLFIGLALLAGVHPAPAQPTLSIAPAGNQMVLFWPAAVTNYILQSTTNLVAPHWVTVSNVVPMTINNNATVTVTNTSLAMFFRLYNTNNNTAPAGMALILAGVFTMGDTLDGESDAIPTNIYVSAFYMDTNLVSYSQWQTVYSYATSQGYSFRHVGLGKAANHPVQTVDWFDCAKWSNARSVQAGLTPVYYTDAGFTQVFTNGDLGIAVYANWTAKGFRLPTEAEWEKAARGGLSGQRFPWDNTISESQANYYGHPNPPDSGGYTYDLGPYTGSNTNFATGGYPYTSPVDFFAPNGYGLYDMAGNVWEWCWDWYATPYGQPSNTNPTGPVDPSGYRVVRGGDWSDDAYVARCAFRNFYNPDYVLNYVGFRCVRGL